MLKLVTKIRILNILKKFNIESKTVKKSVDAPIIMTKVLAIDSFSRDRFKDLINNFV